MILPRVYLPNSHECLVTLHFEHVTKCFQIYKFQTFFYTCDLHDFMSAVIPPLLIVMRQLYTTPCKVQLSMKFCFVKEDVDNEGHTIRLTTTVVTNEHQA